MRKEKEDLLEDLDGCKLTCDNRMQGRLNELKKKREEIMQLKEKVIQCKCKIPQDVAVEVKRTPSLAALCQCSPEDKLLVNIILVYFTCNVALKSKLVNTY